MTSQEYEFVTHWRLPGTPEEVYDVFSDPTNLTDWWPSVYLDVTEVEPANGEESVYEMYTTGWLPYTLRWRLHPGKRVPHERIEIEARGDLVGRGVWTISPTPPSSGQSSTSDLSEVDVVYEWTVRAEKPLLRWFSFLLRPVFAANHRWAMARGEESLRLELARRRASTEDIRAQLSPPPQPTVTRVHPLIPLILALTLVYAVVRSRRG